VPKKATTPKNPPMMARLAWIIGEERAIVELKSRGLLGDVERVPTYHIHHNRSDHALYAGAIPKPP
jgi:hypothetical protein